jgi:hypothetical protein
MRVHCSINEAAFRTVGRPLNTRMITVAKSRLRSLKGFELSPGFNSNHIRVRRSRPQSAEDHFRQTEQRLGSRQAIDFFPCGRWIRLQLYRRDPIARQSRVV